MAALSGHTVSLGQVPWFGEVNNRQMLVDLLPPGDFGLLVDSRTVARRTDAIERFCSGRNRLSSVFYENGKLSHRINVFRGGADVRINPLDYTQVENADGLYIDSFGTFFFERR